MQAELTCPKCGMPQSEWRGNDGAGYDHDGQTYCCQPCVEGEGCICRQQ